MSRPCIALLVSLSVFASVAVGCGNSELDDDEQPVEVTSECTVDEDCDDEIACTEGGCVDGVCEFTPSDEACEGDVCREGVCNPAAGCQTVPYVDGTSCPEGTCSEGECVECIDADDCEGDGRDCAVATCDGGACVYSGDDDLCAPEGPTCTDSMCTNEGCQQVPDDAACEAAGDCTVGRCELDGGCQTDPLAFGESCPDGVCIDGECRECGTEVRLWDNGPLVTHEGTGADGYDESRLQNDSLDMSTLGFSLAGNRLAAEAFRIDDGPWYLDSLVVYSYQTGSDRASTFSALGYEIWDGPPDEFGSSVVHGDRRDNALRDDRFSGIYRTSEINGGPEADDRPIMALNADIDTRLETGTYWIVWRVEGTLDSGPWAPPVTRPGQAATGNARRSDGDLDSWEPVEDDDTGAPQGLPLDLYGHAPTCRD